MSCGEPGRRSQLVAGLLSLVVAAMALSGFVAICGATNAASRLESNSVKLAGAFVDWGAVGREHTLQTWEKWLKQEPTSVLGVDFYGQSNCEDFNKFSWVPGIWKKLNPARNVVWSVPLTVTGTRLADVANGLHDVDFEFAARAIADAQPRENIGLGRERNLSTDGWGA